ncbi:unnamed protein product, partial [Amoebophrya sp. A25]|eukprot:GSA25T00000043001.1
METASKKLVSGKPLRVLIQCFRRRKIVHLPHAGNLDHLGLRLGETSTRLFILGVQPESFGAKVGLKAGMEIVGMNGRALVRYGDHLHDALSVGPHHKDVGSSPAQSPLQITIDGKGVVLKNQFEGRHQ